jgi:hypothetical protein
MQGQKPRSALQAGDRLEDTITEVQPAVESRSGAAGHAVDQD